MDTIEVAIGTPDVDLVKNGLLAAGETKKHYQDKDGKFGVKKSLFSEVLSVQVAGQRVLLLSRPRFQSLPAGNLRIDLSQFANWQDAKKLLARIAGPCLPSVLGGKLRRIDMCVDLGVAFETLQESIYCERVVKREVYSGPHGRTIYFGKAPHQTYIYEKQNMPWRLDLLPEHAGWLPKMGTYCRVESRFTKSKVPIHTLNDLPKLRAFDPFKRLVCQRLDLAATASLSATQKHTAWAFLYRVSQVGFAQARAEFNRNGNYSRNIAKWVTPFNLDLHQAWQRRLMRFFGQNFGEGHYEL